MQKGNKNQHRYGMSGTRAVELEKWGRDTARQRYGKLDYESKPPPQAKDACYPQKLGDPNNLRDPNYSNDVANNWLRGANETAENMPNFQRGYRGKGR